MDTQTLARMRRWRWLSYGLLALSFVLVYFHRMAPAVLATDLAQAFQASGAALGILAASYFFTYTVMQIPSGIFADTLGARRVVALGSVLTGIGAICFAFSPTLSMAVAGRLLVGLGVSVTFIALLKVASEWFLERQFATVTGLTILLGNLGALVSATPLSWALGVTSWRTIFVGLGLVSLLLAAAVWLGVRNRPQDLGLPSMRELEGKPPNEPRDRAWLPGLLEVLRNPQTWPGFIASAGQGGMAFAFAGLWGFPYLRDVHGMDPVTAAHHISFILLGFAIGAMGIGFLSDRLGRRRPVILVGMVLSLLCWLPLLLGLALPTWASYGLFLAFGITAPAYTLTLATAKEVNRPAVSGMATGVVNMGTFLGALLLQPLVGWIMDLNWKGTLIDGVRVYDLQAYRLGLGLLFLATIAGFIAGLRIRETYGRQQGVDPRLQVAAQEKPA